MKNTKNLEFPKNLLYDIFGEDGLKFQVLPDFESYLMSYLSDKKFHMIRLYYKDHMKQSEIAEIFKTSKCRVGQIIGKAKDCLCSVEFLFHIYPTIPKNYNFDMRSDLYILGLRDDVITILKKDNIITVSDIASIGLIGLRSILSKQDVLHLIIKCIINGIHVSKLSCITITEDTDIVHLHLESDLRHKLRYNHDINTINDLLLHTRQDLLKMGLNAIETSIISNLLKKNNYILGSKQYITPLDSDDPRSEYDIHDRLISELNLSNGIINRLAANGIVTIGELIKYTEKQFLKLDGMGKTSFNKISKLLSELGLEFKQDNGLNFGNWVEHARENQKFTIIKGKRTIIASCKKNDLFNKLSNQILFAEIVEWYVSAFDNFTICVVVK